MEYYYVIQENLKTGEQTLLLFNGTREESNKIQYSFPTKDPKYMSTIQGDLRNGGGCHSVKFKNHKQAYKELITKPNEFNAALAIIEKYGFVVVPKQHITSYQSFHETFKII